MVRILGKFRADLVFPLSSRIIPIFLYSSRESRSLFSKDALMYAGMNASRSPETLACQLSALTHKC